MSEELVKIEVDGMLLKARKGAMLIEVADAAGIYIPRFCYHKKLSVAANCRMCLVEVEKAPKPLPACATPVMNGMKVHTESPRAIAAQQGTMEFLLINHPLDCPICDQGGECELQDVAMGYGSDVSQFQERKRVVKDKDVGPLIKTEMTRCIHCTRCVRFGEEIANLRELGATGRGEHMEIGTYIEHSLVSELSGNVIDLCPVGALTAKPSRYRGRSWEYIQHAVVSPHDAVGSNLYLHTFRGRVVRVVPRENEAVNEVWIADRDRFSYEGLYSDDRVTQPLVREQGTLRATEWKEALEVTGNRLKTIIEQHGPEAVGVLVAPHATLEEMYLVQKLARGLGIPNIDHRLRQGDFRDQDSAPVYPWLGMPLAELEKLRAALLIGSNIRMEQPLAAHRLRKAARSGAKIMAINPRDFEFNFSLTRRLIVDPVTLVTTLGGVAKALAEVKGETLPAHLLPVVEEVVLTDDHRIMANNLLDSDISAVLLGNLAVAHPAFSALQALAVFVAQASASALGYLPEAANSVGGWLAGVLPHREAGGKAAALRGLDAREMLESPRKAYVVLGIEPEFDCWDPTVALTALKEADFVVSLMPYASEKAHTYADVVLPIATFAETSGSYVNAEGRCQSFEGAVKPPGEARPAWKVLRVLGNRWQLPGFDYMDSREILDEVLTACVQVKPNNLSINSVKLHSFKPGGLWRVGEVPMYAVDATVRRAKALQQTVWAGSACACLNPVTLAALDLQEVTQVVVRQGKGEVILPLVGDETVPENCVFVPAGVKETQGLGPSIGPVEIKVA